ncbi:hypothetical protein [Nocardia sp. CA-120079]|uniref:hypothetical protein n=1 Tax=Nocardia sp. CA-120079 TaxID=3239974 RepID=UPI003D956353
MNLKTRGMAVTTLTAAAVAIAAGTARADADTGVAVDAKQNQSVTTDVAPGVHFSDDLAVGKSVLSTPFGTVVMQQGQFDVRDATGRTVAGSPIQDEADSAPAASDSPSTAAALPITAAAAPVAGDPMSNFNQAVEAANPHMGAAFAVGSAVGSVLGAVVGCPFGMATGGTLMTLISAGTLTVPALAATCLIGAVAVGGFGATVGGLALAIPVGLAAGTQKYNQLQAQHGTDAPAAPAHS